LLEVPKVTRKLRGGGVKDPLFPPSGGPDQPIGDQAEQEIHDRACVELERPVARQGQRGRQEEVRHIAQDYGAESLNQV